MTSTSDPSSTSPEEVVEQLHRSEWGRLLSLLVAHTRRLDLAEDALSESFARAVSRWPASGVPSNPSGWIFTTARRHVIGALRAEAVAGRKAPLLAVRPGWVAPVESVDELGDERLQLILLCCHPALPAESRSALALRLVVGTSTEEIARLFLVQPATMAARITRAKKKIAVAGIPLSAPVDDELRFRLDEVCRTIYLAFTAGYTPSGGPDLLRVDLAGEAVVLAQLLCGLVPDAAQVRAMTALLLLQHARRDARQRDGKLVLLGDQERSLWRAEEIAAGLRLVEGLTPGSGYAEELRLQACIAAEHARAPTAEATDWRTIADTYSTLEELTGSAVVRLNRAVALAEAEGPRSGLALLEGLDDQLRGSHRLPAVRAELARRAGDLAAARGHYATALERCGNATEHDHLADRLRSLVPPQTDGVPLVGGISNAGAVVRIGPHVLRPSTPHTGAVHAFLRSVRDAGFDGAPEPFGVDEDGRERLEFIEGTVPTSPYPEWSQSDAALASIAALLRGLHDAALPFDPAAFEWAGGLADPAGGSLVCHNDVEFSNVVFRDGVAVALIDFEFAAPGRPVYDLAQMARLCVPIEDDVDQRRIGWLPADRPARLRVVADAYGLDHAGRVDLLAAMEDALDGIEAFARHNLAEGGERAAEMIARTGGLEKYDRRRSWWLRHYDEFAAALD